jgi:hypothetical protein
MENLHELADKWDFPHVLDLFECALHFYGYKNGNSETVRHIYIPLKLTKMAEIGFPSFSQKLLKHLSARKQWQTIEAIQITAKLVVIKNLSEYTSWISSLR